MGSTNRSVVMCGIPNRQSPFVFRLAMCVVGGFKVTSQRVAKEFRLKNRSWYIFDRIIAVKGKFRS